MVLIWSALGYFDHRRQRAGSDRRRLLALRRRGVAGGFHHLLHNAPSGVMTRCRYASRIIPRRAVWLAGGIGLGALLFGLCAGPAAWFLQLVVNYALASYACFPMTSAHSSAARLDGSAPDCS